MSELLNVLMSFSEGERHVEQALRPDWCVLLDSGAFSNFTSGQDLVTVERYGEYLQRRGHLYWKYFNLDVIADAEGSERNFATLRAQGLNPVPIFQRGASADQLRMMLDAHDIVGIGGVAGRLHKKKHAEYLDQVMAVADGRPVHVLGCGSEKILAKHRPFSSDSSSHALRQGTLTLWHNKYLHKLQLKGEVLLDGQPARLQKALLARLCDEYQISAQDLWRQQFYGRNPAKIVNCRSFIRFQRHLRTCYGVEYFIAVLSVDRPRLATAWELENT